MRLATSDNILKFEHPDNKQETNRTWIFPHYYREQGSVLQTIVCYTFLARLYILVIDQYKCSKYKYIYLNKYDYAITPEQ